MHKRFKHYWEEAQGSDVKEQELTDIVCDALDELRMHCPRLYWDTMYKMHCAVYGPHFDECLAKKAVARMKNVDGTHGEYWTYEQTSQLAEQQGIKHKADWYYVMNMLHSDYSEIYGNDITMAQGLGTGALFADNLPSQTEIRGDKLWMTGKK